MRGAAVPTYDSTFGPGDTGQRSVIWIWKEHRQMKVLEADFGSGRSNLHRPFILHLCLTMPKKKIAHSPLSTRPIALCIVNYKKSVTVRKIFKNSLELDQAECCSFFCFEMTTK